MEFAKVHSNKALRWALLYETESETRADYRDIHMSAPNNSNETHTFMCLGRAGLLGSTKTALEIKYEI